MGKKYIICRKTVNWLERHNFFKCSLTRKIIACVLGVDSYSIVKLSIRNRCINVFTNKYLYKFQLYGDNIKKDLKNRQLFYDCRQLLASPIKVHRRNPLTVMMPILKQEIVSDKVVCYILDILKELGHKTAFKMNEYPLVMDGLNVLVNCDCKEISKKLREYLQEQEGVMVRVGIVHGDFHRDNIMFKGNMPVLIDFDCSRGNDIQAVDALYYILEEVRHKHGYRKSWLDEWLLIYKDINIMSEYSCIEQVDIDFKLGLIILFLERISQDQKFNYLFIKNNRHIIKKINYSLDK